MSAKKIIDASDLESLDQELTPTEAEAQERRDREARRTIAVETDFSAQSLCGSWALYHSEARTEQALVVAEPQAGVYLVETYNVVTDAPESQRIIKLDEFSKLDDEGGSWRFYDDRASVRAAFKGLLA